MVSAVEGIAEMDGDQKARSVVRSLDSPYELTFLRVRSRNHEIIVAPDKEYHIGRRVEGVTTGEKRERQLVE